MQIGVSSNRKWLDGSFRVAYSCILGFQAVTFFLLGLAQNSASERKSEQMHHCAEWNKMLVELRRAENQTAAALLDFFLDQNQDAASFNNRIRSLREESDGALKGLEKEGFEPQSSTELRAHFQTYWSFIAPVAQWSEVQRRDDSFRFMRENFRFVRRPLLRAVQRDLDALREVQDQLQSDSERQLAVERERGNVVSAIAIGLFLIVLSIEFSYTTKRARQNTEEYARLGGAKEELSDLSARLLEVQEEERRQLSRELHDGIGQLLTALRMDLADLSSNKYDLAPEIRERLDWSRSVVEQTGSTVRDISLLLRPVGLDDQGLEAALRWQIQDFRRRSGMNCTFAAEITYDKLPDAWNTCIFRVIQEALHNCEKHAAASMVSVQFRNERDRLLIEVQDDGRGFEVAPKDGYPRRSGLGIIGMRERALKLGGELLVRSAPGGGTTLLLSLPVPPKPSGSVPPEAAKPTNIEHVPSSRNREPNVHF